MAVTRVEQNSSTTPATFVYAGTGWTGGNVANQTLADANASGGTHASTSHAGDTVTISIASGYSGALVLLTGRAASGATGTGTLDGTAIPAYPVSNGAASAVTPYNWYQTAIAPIALASGTTHSLVLTNANTLVVDAIELYDTNTAVVPGTIVFAGHSQLYGFQEHNPALSTPVTPTIPAALYALLGGFGTSYVQAVPGEDLTNGGTSGTNTPYYSNSYAPDTGFQRYANPSGSLSAWGGSFSVDSRIGTNGVGAWHNIRPEFAVIMHGFNDLGYTTLYDAPPVGNAANGASALQHVQTLATVTALSGGTFKITQGANSTPLLSAFADGPTITSQLANATPSAIRFTSSGAGGTSNLAFTNGFYTLTAIDYAAQGSSLTLTTNTTTPGVNGLNMSAPSVTGRNTIPAGAGWALLRFKQRLREMIWRMNLNSPGTIILVCGIFGTPGLYLPGAAHDTALLYDLAIRDVCAEATSRNAFFVPMWNIPVAMGGNIVNNYYIWQQQAFPPGGTVDLRSAHLTGEGCAMVAQALYRKIMDVKSMTTGKLGMR